ncbi:MAG: putative toxin-antitoxin system toxin component, PIN family [Thermodesulfobacteriota bacterium]|jgi:putative PIN family toxin of toxin-antitoxin system
MKKRRIILDTNVLYAGLYSSEGASYQILRAIERGEIRIVLTTTLLLEYEDILNKKKLELGLSEKEIEAILDNLCRLSDHQKIYYLWRPFLKDPNDDHILELAVASQTEIIVTHNIKDFKEIEKFGIRSITPKQLLKEIK